MKISGCFPLYKVSANASQKELLKEYLRFAKDIFPDEVYALARKMHIPMDKILLKMLFSPSSYVFSVMLPTFLGIYGNYIAGNHFKEKGLVIRHERLVKTEKGITYADISFMKDGKENLCEVKTCLKLIYYVSPNDINQELLIRYAAKDLLKQIGKLEAHREDYDTPIWFVTFAGTYIDHEILTILEKKDVGVITIPISINNITTAILTQLGDIYNYGRDMLADKMLYPAGVKDMPKQKVKIK